MYVYEAAYLGVERVVNIDAIRPQFFASREDFSKIPPTAAPTRDVEVWSISEVGSATTLYRGWHDLCEPAWHPDSRGVCDCKDDDEEDGW